VATIPARHRVMARSVQRLFESEGMTFTDYVRAQRLAFAHRLLRDPLRAGVKISAIARERLIARKGRPRHGRPFSSVADLPIRHPIG
jgi:AraC-like DNA-binding protein